MSCLCSSDYFAPAIFTQRNSSFLKHAKGTCHISHVQNGMCNFSQVLYEKCHAILPRSHMRHMRQMNNMMNSLFSDPFGMLGGVGPLAIAGPRHGGALMPFMPQMPSMNRLFSGNVCCKYCCFFMCF